MGKIGEIVFFILLVVVSAASALAQTVVTASVEPNPVVVGEQLRLVVSIRAETAIQIDSVKLPSLDGFSLIGGDDGEIGQRSQTIFSNGQLQTIVSREYGLIAERPGDFRIGSIAVVVDGDVKRTGPVPVKVLAAGSRPQRRQAQPSRPGNLLDEDDPDQIFSQLLQRHGIGSGFQAQPVNPNEAYHVLVEADKTKVYVGEQVTASWYLATRGLIREFDPLKYPQLKGFWKEDIEIATSLNFQSEVINGMPYKKALLMRSALFPIKAGPNTIDPYKTKATVILGGGAFGGMGFGQPYVFNKASQEIKINVLPLPTEGRPADFTGAVGTFQLTSAVNTSNVVAHQPFEYKLRIAGQGNAKSIELPPLNLPPSLELYDQKSDSKFSPDGTSYKDFTLYLIPRQSGAVMVPSISMSYFDPRTGNYVKKSAPELKVQVREGAAPGAGSTPLEQAADKSGSAAKSKASSSAFGLALEWREPKHESDLWPLWVAAYCLVAIFLILAARQMGLLGRVDLQKRLQRELKARFKDLKASAQKGDWRQVGARGTNLLYFVLGQLSEQGGAQFEINQMLEKIPPSLRLEMKDQVEALLRELEILSFAPESYSASKRSKEHLVDVAHQLEKLLGRAISIFSGEASGSGRNKA